MADLKDENPRGPSKADTAKAIAKATGKSDEDDKAEEKHAEVPATSLGMPVHYVLPSDSPWAGEHRFALVTHVVTPEPDAPDPGSLVGRVDLTVFKVNTDDLMHLNTDNHGVPVSALKDVVHSALALPGTWHEPEPPEPPPTDAKDKDKAKDKA